MLFGYLEFDDWTGNLHAGFYSSDRSVIESRFDDGSKVAIRCRVEAFLPGNAGSLAEAHFTIEFVSESQAESCADTKPQLLDITHSTGERLEIPVYQIADSGTAAN
jgi:hypothetical protein